MKAQADQKKQDMETAMLGGEAEPEGMDFDNYGNYYNDYGEEDYNNSAHNYMGGSKEKRGENLQVPHKKDRKDRVSDDEGG